MHKLSLFWIVAALAFQSPSRGIAEETTDEREWAALKAADKAFVEAAMNRSEAGASREELDSLPLPVFVYSYMLERALSFDSAWLSRSAPLHEEQDSAAKLHAAAFHGAHLYYYEWACETGEEKRIAAGFMNLIPRVVTTYPEKLLLKYFIQERERMGYDRSRSCNTEELRRLRAQYEEFRNELAQLARQGS